MAIQDILNTHPHLGLRLYGPVDLGVNSLVVPNGSRSVESVIVDMSLAQQLTLIVTASAATDIYLSVYGEDGVTVVSAIKFAAVAAAATAIINIGLEMQPQITNGTFYGTAALRLPLRSMSFSFQGTAGAGTATSRLFLAYDGE